MSMGHGSATMAERGEIHDMFMNHDRIMRTVTNLPDGIRTVTESDDPELAVVIASHVAGMIVRVKDGGDPKLPIARPWRSSFAIGTRSERRSRRRRKELL